MFRVLTLTCLSCFLPVIAHPADGDGSGAKPFPAAGIEFFEKNIRPVLAENCYDCHSGVKARVGLQLDHRDGWLRGTDYGKIVTLENPSESRVLRALRHQPGVKPMPEKGGKLSEEIASDFQEWIAMGLPWPDRPSEPSTSNPREHWSFQPVTTPPVPAGADHPIDAFVRAKMEEKKLPPAPRADRRSLYRRLSYNLLGLPPKHAEQSAFVDDPASHAERWPILIDRFLASPHYGERWARHWMDVARYSDTKGYEAGGRERKFIFSHTYRDWLIRAFNEDIPYDQFIVHQLAAEQVVDWEGANRHHLAALGFISLSKNGKQELIVDDRIDTTFRGLMGLTVSCARCHDHKSDPISTGEYYSLFGIFRNSMEGDQIPIAEPPNTPAYRKYLDDVAALRQKRTDYLKPLFEQVLKRHPKLNPDNEAGLIQKLTPDERKKQRQMSESVEKFIARSEMEPDKALIVKDRNSPYQQAIYIRGNPSRRGDIVPPRFLQLGSETPPPPFEVGSGRLELARQIASPENPLTARVIVNRVWMWHFGEGLVRTVGDFGLEGEPPSHPELLDWLAAWFMDHGWSLKELHRLILTSETWQQQTTNPRAADWSLVDPENRLLWKSFTRRLDFEQMRDSILAVSGELDTALYGRSETILAPPFSDRRTVYAFIDRQNLPSVFRHFDFSNPQETTGKRPQTTIPMQALFTLNSEFVMNRASRLSAAVEASPDPIGELHRRVFAREPSAEDRQLAESFLSSFDSADEAPRQNLTGWSYGWGGLGNGGNELTFNLFEHWDGKARDWRPRAEYPIRNSPLSYLHIGSSSHPGLGDDHACILRWHAPRKMTIEISGELERPAVGKGRTGVNLTIHSSRNGVIHTSGVRVDQASVPVAISGIEVEEGEMIHFIVDCDGDTSHDTYRWDPAISNSDDPGERWKHSVDFAGPKSPLNARQAYAQALFNTNRFLFIR